MLKVKWFFVYCCFMAGFAQLAKAQEDPFLDFIGGTENEGKVFLQWVMKAGTTCDGIRIYRSTDKQSFDQIGSIAGICGSPDFAVGYTFTDEEPHLNQINHYRLELGNLGFSGTIAIEVFDFSTQPYRLMPHPVKSQSKLHFENSGQTAKQLSLVDINGRLVYQDETSGNVFQLDADNLSSGVFLFTIGNKDGQQTIQGKIIISR